MSLRGSDEAYSYGAYNWEILETGTSEPLLKLPDTMNPALSPDGEYVVAKPRDKNAVLMQVSTGQTLCEFPHSRHAYSFPSVFAPDSRTAAVHGGLDGYKVIRITENGCVETLLDFHSDTWISSQCFSADGKRLLSASWDGEAWLHDTTTGRLLHTLREPQQLRPEYVPPPEVWGIEMPFITYLGDFAGNFTNLANMKPRLDAAFIGNGAQVVTVAGNQMLRVWDAQTGRAVHVIDPGMSNMRSENGNMENNIMLSDNGAYVLTWNRNDGYASLWDTRKGALVREYSDWESHYQAMHVSDTGTTIYLTIFNSLYSLGGR